MLGPVPMEERANLGTPSSVLCIDKRNEGDTSDFLVERARRSSTS